MTCSYDSVKQVKAGRSSTKYMVTMMVRDRSEIITGASWEGVEVGTFMGVFSDLEKKYDFPHNLGLGHIENYSSVLA